MKNILLTIEYDGTNFCGWQRQPKQRSIQAELEHALSVVCAEPVKINGTSRTDAGVHAYGQRASFKGDFGIPTDRIAIAANNIMAGSASGRGGLLAAVGDVFIKEAKEVSLDFHARFDAAGKKYLYKLRNSDRVDIFDRNYSYQIANPLDLNEMKRAAAQMVGTHDFKCFQAAGGKEMETTVRTIYSIRFIEEELRVEKENTPVKMITIEVIGDGFLYNMVRIITGTLVDVGTGKLSIERIPVIIEGRDRKLAGHTAPPQGLYLAEVYYDKTELK